MDHQLKRPRIEDYSSVREAKRARGEPAQDLSDENGAKKINHVGRRQNSLPEW